LTPSGSCRDVLGSLDDPGRFLVEGYFEGVGVGVSVLAENGVVLQAFQHRRLRQGRGGSSSYRVSEPIDPRLREACDKICRRTNLTGVCMFEFRVNPSDRSWILLETNARFWGSSPLPISLGVDFPRFLYDLLVHQARHPLATYPVGIRSRNFILDGFNLFKRPPGLQAGPIGRWVADIGDFLMQPIRWSSGRERSDTFVRDDLAPAFWECATVLRTLGRRPGRTRIAPPEEPSEGMPPRLEAAAP
jgi:hypothetical protein